MANVERIDLAGLLAGLTELPESGYRVAQIPNFPMHRVGRNSDGAPVVLLGSVDASASASFATTMENLFIGENVLCKVVNEHGAASSSRFTVIEFRGKNRDLEEHFIGLGGVLVEAVGEEPTSKDVVKAVWQFVDLFRVRSSPPLTTVQGLWGELFVISRMPNPSVLITAWRVGDEDWWDFNGGTWRLEVKTTSRKERHHHLSLEQVTAPGSATVTIASIITKRVPAGTSIRDLLTRIAQKVDSARVMLGLEARVANTLGVAYSDADAIGFDIELAENTLKFFDAGDIPRFTVPAEIWDVRFACDLGSLTPLSEADVLRRLTESSSLDRRRTRLTDS